MVMAGSPDADLREEVSLEGVTTGDASRSFNCTQCNAKFSRLAHLRRHQRSHRPEKPFSCLYCSVSSSRKDVIIRHTRNFHPEKVPRCDEARYASNSSTYCCPSRQELVGSDRTAGYEEHRRSGVFEARPPRPSSAGGEISENLGDCVVDLVNPLAEANSLLGLHDPTLSIQNMFDILGTFQFADQGLSQIFKSDYVPSPTNGLATALHEQKEIGISSLQALPSPVSSFSTSSCPPESRGSFFIEDDKYESAKANYDYFNTTERLSRFRFPSKFAVSRFVRGFFEYMAPHLPIVHVPTFNIASTSPPLLIEIMACGAFYSNEQGAAQDLHTTALLLMREHDEMILIGERDNKFQLWVLQASLLICYFGAFSGDSQRECRAAQTLSQTMKFSDEALKEISISEAATYKEWVQQETLNRCLAGGIILGAAFFSKSKDRCFSLAILDARFPLPSSTASWLRDENSWEKPDKTIYSSDALKMIFEGCKIAFHDTDFGFATIVSAVLCHVCDFESLVGTQHPDLFTSFIEKMDRSVQVLKDIQKEQLSGQFLIESTMTSMAHTARSMILSITYHLYGSHYLMAMKRLFHSPGLLDCQESLEQCFDERHSATLEKALVLAAEMLRSDCQTGLGYIKSFGHLRFAPMSVIAAYEGGLLLCWYLQNKQSKLSPDPILDTLIDDALSETEGSMHSPASPLAAFPLAVYANLFDTSVWQFLRDVSHRLTQVTVQLKHMC
ncbi:hypothetical protein B0J13DRAFT_556236 [Dactylonectria estremocensis]|uniref:C2H2-type domain-containing protein n=1 Tax=Dactylonectria estremocensis TaxID=1079267 RepID=A0A9P9ET03_9HYPO|nr:hypothetical protein B0J13DRAFT_556236 [Dactylonectria estremocensis]